MQSKLSDLGERSIISVIRKQYAYSWPDDDASLIDAGRDYAIITTDSISKQSHIPDGADHSKVGYYFAALNLSDIAAMGGTPKYFMAAMTLNRDMPLAELVKIQKGMRRCLDRYGVKLIGGDLKEGSQLSMAGIAIGTVQKKNVLLRSGARHGDLVCLTGKLGKNAAAYYMWKKHGGKKWAQLMIDIEPRVKEGMMIAEHGGSSAIDLSDGLNASVLNLNRISGKGFEIDYDRIPISSLARQVSKNLKIGLEELALNFGGEYELVFTISKRDFSRLGPAMTRRGFEVTVIGRVFGKDALLVKDGKRTVITKGGYEHFR